MCCCGEDEPIFSHAKPPIIAAALSRAHLNDARRRLVAIRAACGFMDIDPTGQQDDDKEKDPFVALVKDFNYYIEQVRAQATDSINDLKERTQIRQDMQKAKETLQEMKKMVEEADAELCTAELKNKSVEKIGKLSDAFGRYKDTLDRCNALYEEVKAATTGFTWNNPSQLKKSDTYQKALRLLAARSGLAQNGDGADGVEDPDDEEMRNYAAQNEGVTLDNAQETKEQMMLIQKQKRQVQTALDRIHASVLVVREMALQLRAETNTQVVQLEDLDDHMKFSVENLRSGNARLTRLNKSMQPFNICVNCCIFIIILAATGFLLYRYNAI